MHDQAENLRELMSRNSSSTSVKKARIITVTSGKGGVGKTNFAVNLSIALSQLSQRVILVDADLGLANVDVVLGVIPQYHLGHVISGQRKVGEILLEGPEGIKIVASGSGLQDLANLSEWRLDQCVRELGQLEDMADIILFDTGAGLSRSVVRFILATEEVIVVTTPEPTAMTDAYSIIKVIASKSPSTRIRLVVNMVHQEKEGIQVVERLKLVAKRFLDVEIDRMGLIYYDAVVSAAVKEQQPFVISHPNAMASQCIRQMARGLVMAPVERPAGFGSFLRRLVGRPT
jgi:flagellar biosynthesis protein FlhG